MHSADYVPPPPTITTTTTTNGSATHTAFTSNVRVEFSAAQTLNALSSPATASSSSSLSSTFLEQRKISDLIAHKVAHQEFFYGIELAARSYGPTATVLNYGEFGALMPLFTSLIWFGLDYWNATHVTDVESLQLARQLRQATTVLPHFTCYRTDRRRLQEFLALNYTNVLALRGDHVHGGQEFQHAVDLVRAIREVRGDAVSIGVGAYPEGHPDAESLEQDMQYLLEKVNAGADFIVTQLCFTASALQQFVRRCRALGVRIPIVIGIFVPENFRMLERMASITQVRPTNADWTRYVALRHDATGFRDFAVERAVQLIESVLDDSAQANLDVYGVHFFTTNRFKCVQRVLQRLRELHENKNQIN